MNEKILDTGVKAGPKHNQYNLSPYYAKVIETIDNGAKYAKYLRIGIFERATMPSDIQKEESSPISPYSDQDRLIGDYIRYYSSPLSTFHPFELRGKWYALYSSDYEYTDLMELPSCKRIGGEIRNDDGGGFCPAEYWVPPLFSQKTRLQSGREHSLLQFPDRIHGFVAGCLWGDDSSWKIQYLDLSRADEGIIIRDERFGYIELPDRFQLKEAISIRREDEKYDSITITLEKHFCLQTGKELEEY